MTQEVFERGLTKEWVALGDLITVESDTTYYIQNRGPDVLVALQASGQPEADNDGGDLVLPNVQAEYIKGTQDLYLRAFHNNCSINITKKG
jgi:hypothetical protein